MTNFSIAPDFSGLRFNGFYLDVRKCFDLASMEKDEARKTASLLFTAPDSALGATNTFPNFMLAFENVKVLYEQGADANYPLESLDTDKSCVDLLGYSSDDDEIMDGPADWQMREGLNSLLLVLVMNAAIKITAERVLLKWIE